MTLDWHTEYARALEGFGNDTPGPQLEHELLRAFEQHPQAVSNAITKIARGYAAGKIHSPWGALKAEIPKQIDRDIHVGDGKERNRRIHNAEAWMRNAGLHTPSWDEAQAHLYDSDEATLAPWRTDHELQDRMHQLWLQHRPTGIQLDHEADERGAAWIAQQKRIAALPKVPTPTKA